MDSASEPHLLDSEDFQLGVHTIWRLQNAMPNIQEISSTGSNRGGSPQPHELEVSLFGPGYGESVLIHLGNNEWMIVDSCIDPVSRNPAPLEYLKSIEVGTSAVKLIVATHWHDDHIRGLGTLLQQCHEAKFVCSSALKSYQFLELVMAYETRSLITTSGAREFGAIIKILSDREKLKKESSGLQWAVADRSLWKRPATPGSIPFAEVHALSPSDASVTLAFHEIASLLPRIREPKKRIVTQPPNHTAVAMWVVIADISILLGSDLEETSNPGTGWSVIVKSTTRPSGKATLLKVPHHGSSNADSPSVWERMLETNPIAILTPFNKGGVVLPTKTDAIRICGRTEKAYSSSVVNSKKLRIDLLQWKGPSEKQFVVFDK